MTNNDTIKALREELAHMREFIASPYLVESGYTAEQFVASQETTKHWLDRITILITQLEQAEGVDLEKGARAIWDAVPHHCEVTWDEAKKLEFMQQEYKATVRQARACYEANNIKVKE